MSCSSSASSSPSSSSASSSTWADLPNHILELLVRSMHSSADRVRFGAFCRSWSDVAAAVKQNPVGPFGVVPLPLMTFRDPADGVLKGGGAVEAPEATPVTRCFYSLSEDKVYRLQVPSESRDWRCFGCSRGWLGMIDLFAKPFLFDPFSGARVDLPSLTTLTRIITSTRKMGKRDGEILYFYERPIHGVCVMTATNVRDTFINRLALSSSPLDDPNCVVMITVIDFFRLPAYTRLGDDAWVQVPDLRKDCRHFLDIVYHKGVFYALVGEVEVIAITFGHPNSPPSVKVLVPTVDYPSESCGYYLVVLPSGGLLRVTRYRDVSSQETTYFFQLHKLVVDEEGAVLWVKTEDIGDCCLFLGTADSISLPASEILGKYRANYIFFTDDHDRRSFEREDRGARKCLDYGMYEIKKAKFEHFCHTDVRRVVSQSLWITPRF